jgi:hypothetical protein
MADGVRAQYGDPPPPEPDRGPVVPGGAGRETDGQRRRPPNPPKSVVSSSDIAGSDGLEPATSRATGRYRFTRHSRFAPEFRSRAGKSRNFRAE